MIFKNLCVLMVWTKVASALEGLKWLFRGHPKPPGYFPHREVLATVGNYISYVQVESSYYMNDADWSTGARRSLNTK